MARNSFQAQAPQVQSVGVGVGQPPVAGELAAGIEAVGSFAGAVRKEFIKDDLKTEIGGFGEQALAVSQQDPSSIDIAQLSQAEQAELSDADRRLRRLKRLKKDNRWSESAIQIEAEKILQDKIRQAPGFESEFRQLAASTLGYDPTGATVQTMFGLATQEPEESEGLNIPAGLKGTEFGRGVITILQQQQLGQLSEEQGQQAMRDLSSTINTNRQIENLEAELSVNAISAERYANKFLQLGAQEAHKDVFRSMFFEQGPNGELQPRESVDATEIQQTIVGRKNAMTSTLRKNLVEQGRTITNELDKQIRDRVDRQFEDIESLAQNRDLLERINRESGVIQSAFQVEAAKVAPILKFADTLGVAPEYLDLLKTPQQYRSIARTIMPGLDAAGDIADMPNEIHNRISETLAGQIDWKVPEQRDAHSDAVSTLVNGGSVEEQESALETLRRTGKPGYNISNYSKEEFARTNIRPENTKKFGDFLNGQAKVVINSGFEERIREAMAPFNEENHQRAVLRIEDGKLRAVVQEKQHTTGKWLDRAAPGSVANEIAKINAIHSAAQNGWSSDIEDWNPSWLKNWQERILQGDE